MECQEITANDISASLRPRGASRKAYDDNNLVSLCVLHRTLHYSAHRQEGVTRCSTIDAQCLGEWTRLIMHLPTWTGPGFSLSGASWRGCGCITIDSLLTSTLRASHPRPSSRFQHSSASSNFPTASPSLLLAHSHSAHRHCR